MSPGQTITTPQILRLSALAIAITSALMMWAAIAGARSHRHAMQVVGKDSAPSIIAAQRIRAALADMDAGAAQDLAGVPGARERFDRRREEAVSAIVAAAENITYGDAERIPIRTLALGVGRYAEAIQAARDKRDVAAWRTAAQFLDQTLLPAAVALDQANHKALDEAYADQKKASGVAMTMLVLGAVLTGAALLATQFFLTARMRRILNPLLVAATLAAWFFVVWAGQRFQKSDRDLRTAKEDAFESIHALWQARALAYSARGDLNRAAFDTAQRALYTEAFAQKTAGIRDRYLAGELKNITFAGEGEAARDAASHFDKYRVSQSPEDFGNFDEALGRTLDVNQREFDAAVARGFADVASFEIAAPLGALLIVALAGAGLWPRLREYSV